MQESPKGDFTSAAKGRSFLRGGGGWKLKRTPQPKETNRASYLNGV